MLLPDNTPLTKEEQDGLGTSEGYVVITDEDIVEGVAAFVAKLISTIPQSKVCQNQDLPPWTFLKFHELSYRIHDASLVVEQFCNLLRDLFISVT